MSLAVDCYFQHPLSKLVKMCTSWGQPDRDTSGLFTQENWGLFTCLTPNILLFCAHQEGKRKRGRERREWRVHNSSIGLIKIQSCVTGGDERRPVCVASITEDKKRLLRDKRKYLCPLLLSVDLIFLAQTEPQKSNDNQANSWLLAYFYLRKNNNIFICCCKQRQMSNGQISWGLSCNIVLLLV